MSGNNLTPEMLKRQHMTAIAESNTFETLGVSKEAAKDYLRTQDGAMYWWRLAEADPTASTRDLDKRAIGQLTSGLELPRMETIGTHEALVKLVAEDSSPSAHSPYWARESEVNAEIAAGRNISDRFGLPIDSESPRYNMYRITPQFPTQVFVNTVAPTSELGGLVTKSGGAEQYLVPNRKLFSEPVYIRTIDNIPNLAANVEHSGLSPSMWRAAKVLGPAAVAYDGATTLARASDSLHAGNTTGAQSQVEHFGARNLGALGGAVLGAELFGTAGLETGPIDLLIGGAGAIGGAIAGDKLADAVDNHRIYNQTDPQGTSWHYDPNQPQHGWARTITDSFAERGLSSTHAETAPPALADRLTFQANNKAVELALPHAATPRDPYTQQAGAGDTPSHVDAPWTRDAQTRQWSRHVTDQVMEHGLASAHTEVATPQRAAQLDSAAQQTITANLANSPRGMAEHYQAAYQQRGWAQYGPMPEAVTSALETPTQTLEASDGHVYTRGQNGQWNTPGTLWGTNPAQGNVRVELDATARTEANAASSQNRAPTPPQINEPGHPDHAMFQQAQRGVHAIDTQHGRTPDIKSDQVAAALAVASRERGYNSIDVVMLGTDGAHVFANQGSAGSGQVAYVNKEQAANTPITQSSEQWQQVVNQQQVQAQQAQIQAQTQTQSSPAFAR